MDPTKTNVRELQADLERAAKQAGKCELGRRVHEALHNDAVQWPPLASEVLTVPHLASERADHSARDGRAYSARKKAE